MLIVRCRNNLLRTHISKNINLKICLEGNLKLTTSQLRYLRRNSVTNSVTKLIAANKIATSLHYGDIIILQPNCKVCKKTRQTVKTFL